MVNVAFGGPGGSAFTAFFPLTSSPIPLASGRVMANGSTAVLPVQLSILVGGNGATRSVSASVAGAAASYSVPNGSPATRSAACSGAMFNGGSGTLTISASGSINFGRAGTGSTSDGHTAFGNVIGGSYDYIQSPTAMAAPTLSAASGHLTVAFSAPSDDGDGTISGYVIQYSTDPTFASTSTTTSVSSPVTVAVPNGMYYVRVTSKNQCTTAAGTYAPWSATSSQRVGVGGARWDATAVAEVPYTATKRWDATAGAEVSLTVAKRWDAVAGVERDL